MDEPETPPPASISAEDATRCVDAYIDAWNEPDASARSQIFARVLTEDAVYLDPARRTDSRADLVEYVGEVLHRQPGRRIVRTSEVDAHSLVCRFNWQLVRLDGTRGQESIDVVEFDGDGRIRRLTGFFGPLAPRELAP